jgi:predicted type IV restriction endonuclease
MVKQKLDPEVRKNILKAQRWIEDIAKKDANENETRTRIYDIFGMLMGYDRYEHITQEYAIQTAGETTHCDLAIQINQKESSKPDLLIEIKKVNIDLASRHIRQAASYAIDIGCEWVLLTNSKDWKLYHISFEKPPQTILVDSWNIINDTPSVLADKFGIICYKNIKRNGLSHLWEKSNVLTPQNILKIILTEHSLTSIRRELKKTTGVTVTPEELVGAIRRMLNEAAVGEMEKIKISLPDKKPKKSPSPKRNITKEENKQEV